MILSEPQKQTLTYGKPYPNWCNTCQKSTTHVYAWDDRRRHWVTCLDCYPEAWRLVAEEYRHG